MAGQKRWILLCIAGTVLFLGMTVALALASNGLFSDVENEQVATLSTGKVRSDSAVVRTRYVKVEFGYVQGDQFPEGASSILLNLFEDVSFQATKERLEKRSSTRYTWFGRVRGSAISEVILVVEDSVMAGNVLVDGEMYQIRAVNGGIHAIRKIDQSRFPEEAPPIPVDIAPDQSESLTVPTQTDDGSLIDVLVVYTAAAAAASSDIMAEIQLAVDETNQSYANSGIIQRVRLVHAAQVNYTETGKSDRDLARLQNPNGGHLDEVHSMRDAYGADLVSLWVENLDACGIGYLMRNVSTTFANHAFSVIARNCATGYYSFGHEMGHNMGANHDRYTDSSKGAYSYSHGYVDTCGMWRTVTAYNNECSDQKISCTRIPYWSNPSVNYLGNPTGISQKARDSANNVLTLNNTAHTVANFRACVVNTLEMVATLENPQNGKMVSGITTVHGWAIDGKGITKVELFVDGQFVGNIPYGGMRMDVKSAYPNYPNSGDSGFGMVLNYSNLSSGNHTISARVHNQDGKTLPLDATVTVKKFHGEFVEGMSPKTWLLKNNSVKIGADTRDYDIQIEWLDELQGYGITDVIPK